MKILLLVLFILQINLFACASLNEVKSDKFIKKNKINESEKIDTYLSEEKSIVVRFLCDASGRLMIDRIYLNKDLVNDSDVVKARMKNAKIKNKSKSVFLDYIEIAHGNNFTCYKPGIGIDNPKLFSVFHAYENKEQIKFPLNTNLFSIFNFSLSRQSIPQYSKPIINIDTVNLIGQIIVTKLAKELRLVYGRMPHDRLENLANKYNLSTHSIGSEKQDDYVYVANKNLSIKYIGDTKTIGMRSRVNGTLRFSECKT